MMAPAAARTGRESAQRLSDCVTALLRDQPFFGSLALRLPIRADASRETLASDGHEIRYSPQWVADTDADLIKTAIGRVVLACILKHHTRRRERDPERWQRASQLVTHGLLRDAGFTLPTDTEAWEGLSVEQAYDRLPEPQDGGGEENNSPTSGGGGNAAGAQSATSDDDPGGPDDPSDNGHPQDGGGDDSSDTGDPSNNGDPKDKDGPETGGGSDAPPSFDPGGTGEIMDAGSRNGDGDASAEAPIDTAAEEQAWDEAMHQALSLAKAQGKSPGAVEETIRGAHASVLDWRTLLRRYMTDAARSDYSWSLPNRRFIDDGLYLPSIRSEGIDTIAVIIDTSASLPATTLAAFWTEVREIAAELQPVTVIVLQVDAALQEAANYSAGDLPGEIALKGRGGTDFRPGFAWLAEQGLRPSCCLYFTDMECDSYPEGKRWNEFVARYHYLGYKTLVGAQMRYAVHDRHGAPLAMLGFSTAARKLAPRDSFIGWTPQLREKNLPFVIDNPRFLILPWVTIPNLGSHILSLVRRQLPDDWTERYNTTPVLIETFVETPRFTGALYKASGWTLVGTTKGRGRYDRHTKRDQPKKEIWLRPLRKDWQRTLNR